MQIGPAGQIGEASRGERLLAGLGRVKVVPEQILVLRGGGGGRERAAAGTGEVAAPHRRGDIGQPVRRRIGDRVIDQRVGVEDMHTNRASAGDRGKLTGECRIVCVGKLRGLGIERGRRRVAAVGQPQGDIRHLAEIGDVHHQQVLRAIPLELRDERDLIGDGIIHVGGLLLRRQAGLVEDVEQVVRSDRQRIERVGGRFRHQRLELRELRRQRKRLSRHITRALRCRSCFGAAISEIPAAGQTRLEGAEAEGEGKVLHPGRPVAEHVASDRAVLFIVIGRRHRFRRERYRGDDREVARVGQAIAECINGAVVGHG